MGCAVENWANGLLRTHYSATPYHSCGNLASVLWVGGFRSFCLLPVFCSVHIGPQCINAAVMHLSICSSGRLVSVGPLKWNDARHASQDPKTFLKT